MMFAANTVRARAPLANKATTRNMRNMRARAEEEKGDDNLFKNAEVSLGLGEQTKAVADKVDPNTNGAKQVKEDLSNVTHPATPSSAIGDTLIPRVEEIRGKYLQEGTSDFTQLMKFSGPAPELINGRLAMIGFVAALGAELSTHQTLVKQFTEAPAVIVGFSTLIAIASLIPMIRGTKKFDDGFGEGIRPGFNVTNELINGRAAMLGIALVVIFESGARSSLF